jgi:Tfp pilus assembly protein FimV
VVRSGERVYRRPDRVLYAVPDWPVAPSDAPPFSARYSAAPGPTGRHRTDLAPAGDAWPRGSRPAATVVHGTPHRHPSTRPVRRPERYAPVRLTRRGKIVAQLVLILAAVLTVIGVAAGTRAAAEGPEPAGPRPSIVVQPGDTLWNIASRHAPGVDRRATMDEIRRINHLDGSTVEVGQKLILPRR